MESYLLLFIFNVRKSYEQYHESHYAAEEKSYHHLRQRMLAKNHSARAKHTGNDEHHTQPEHGIVGEHDGECSYRTGHTANGGSVGADLPPYIDDRTEYLNHQCHNKYARHEMGNVHALHDIHTYEIAQDGDDIGHHTTLALAEFDESPTLMMAIEGDEESGSEDREDIHESEDHHLVGQWQQTEVAQRKQNNEPHSGQVEGIEHCAQHPCAQYQFISSLHFNLQFSTFNFQLFLNLFTGIPSISRYFDTVRRAMG